MSGIALGAEKTDLFYHSPGGLELYGEPRHTTYRSRADLDYPRSPLPFQNRYEFDNTCLEVVKYTNREREMLGL